MKKRLFVLAIVACALLGPVGARADQSESAPFPSAYASHDTEYVSYVPLGNRPQMSAASNVTKETGSIVASASVSAGGLAALTGSASAYADGLMASAPLVIPSDASAMRVRATIHINHAEGTYSDPDNGRVLGHPSFELVVFGGLRFSEWYGYSRVGQSEYMMYSDDGPTAIDDRDITLIADFDPSWIPYARDAAEARLVCGLEVRVASNKRAASVSAAVDAVVTSMVLEFQ